ncbi:MAG TPA: ribbon-helix-helix protein, CopG family [Vicinamibacteria bacterium]|nr:ribbon-helix-helix protein, CopG family [Vicinamibacteria bacterium]
MARITISLSEDTHRAVKEAAARQGKTIGKIIEESLAFYGIKSSARAVELVARAREYAGLSEHEALQLATEETDAERQR